MDTLSEEIDNAVVRQKDKILKLINDDKFEKAAEILVFVTDLWNAIGYDYKRCEISLRIREASQNVSPAKRRCIELLINEAQMIATFGADYLTTPK